MFKIESVLIITGQGPDYIYLRTNLPSAAFPFVGYQDLGFHCAAGQGETYCEKNFEGVNIEVLPIKEIKGI